MSHGYQSFVAWRYLMARPRKVSRAIVAVAATLFVAAAVLAAIGLFVLEQPDPSSVVPTGSPHRDTVLLTAVGLTALGELAIMLAVVRYYFTFFTTVSIAGCGIGTMALVIVLSVMSGFETDLRNKILGSNAHILITKEDGEFREYREVAKEIAGIRGVVAQTPYASSEVVIAANNNYANVIIKGIDPMTVSRVTDLQESLDQDRALERLWPLADDGGIAGPPSDAGPEDAGVGDAAGGADATDPAPPDFRFQETAPEDLSGDSPAAGPGPAEPAPSDPAPDDFEAPGGEPMDLSGGEPLDRPDALEEYRDEFGAGGRPAEHVRVRARVAEPVTDPAPSDMKVPGDEPLDLSGGDAAAGDDAGPEDDAEEHLDGDEELDHVPSLDLEGDTDVIVHGLTPHTTAEEVFDFGRYNHPVIPPRVARLPGVLVGSELVKVIHLYVGQEVRIVSPLAQDTPAGPMPRTAWFRVAGTFYTGMYEYDLKYIYVDLSELQSFLDIGDQVNGIEIRVTDPDDTEPVLARLIERLGPGYRVQDWKEINRNLFSALKLEKIAMFLVLAIIILVASFSIIGNLIMVVVEKAKEIALLKTLGSSDHQIMQIFVVQGLIIGIVGSLVGVLHGLIISYLGGRFGLPLDPDVYYIDRLPIHIEGSSVAAVLAAGILISVVATLYPAYMAARLRPVEGMRYE